LRYATGSAGLAILVRGSSRWIMTMRFRPANIRLINRRPICFGCRWPCPRKNKNHPAAVQGLTGSLHISIFDSHTDIATSFKGAFLEEKATWHPGFCKQQNRKCCKAPGSADGLQSHPVFGRGKTVPFTPAMRVQRSQDFSSNLKRLNRLAPRAARLAAGADCRPDPPPRAAFRLPERGLRHPRAPIGS
jgi:hypothetical protein